jgi:hypothetical protein
MKVRAWWLVLALLLPAAVLAKGWKAHKGYEGADPPAEELVHLKVSQDTDIEILISRRGISVESIDGKSMANWWSNTKVVDEILFKPGKHRIGYLTTQWGGRYGLMQLWFVAEPGKSYVTRQELGGSTFRIWIEDVATGERVGGIVGSADEPPETEAVEAPAVDVAAPAAASN